MTRWFFAIATFACLARGESSDDDFWRQPETTLYEKHMRAGDDAALRAARRHQHNQAPANLELAELAVREYEAAAAVDPKQGEPHFRAAEIAYAHFINEQARPERQWLERAIQYWVRFEDLRPKDPRLEAVLFRRSITYTKLGGDNYYRLALSDYEKLLEFSDTSESVRASSSALILSNTAELYMVVGELEAAITLYQRALRLEDRPLYGYGLALALWRFGQVQKSIEIMQRYAKSDRLRALSDHNVFFVPEGEVHAYLALGWEALGEPHKAEKEYKAFLQSEAKARYGNKVQKRLEELQRSSRKPKKDRK